MSLCDRSKREIIDHLKTTEAMVGVKEIYIQSLAAENAAMKENLAAQGEMLQAAVVGKSAAEHRVSALYEERDSLKARLAAADWDTARLDWLIREGPPGAAPGSGLNEDLWDCAVGMIREEDDEPRDTELIRRAIDAAIAARGEGKG